MDTVEVRGPDRASRPLKKASHRFTAWTNLKKFKILYLMFLPGALFLLINNYLPMAGVVMAFKNVNFTDGPFRSPWSGLQNFKYLFATDAAWSTTYNTLMYNSIFIALNLVIGVGMAVMLYEVKSRRLSKLYQSAMFFPYFLSMVVISYLVLAFLGVETGYINTSVLKALGLEPIDWYMTPEYWTYILPFVNVWKNIGYYVVIYYAAIIGIDEEYFEAAVLDGAGKWKQIMNITIPFLSPLIITMTLLQIGRIFYADFGLFFNVPLDAGPLYPSTQVIDTYVYRTFIQNGDAGMASAAGLYQAFVGFVLVLLANFAVRKFDKNSALF
ncbi:putative aldouronate transport system permease protein [Paenibacillus sp. UNCCL117]|uniref:ABC transporter permease n=1 Tax=unclassified Paenibacillus TaxID=185978 RepID=UPI000888B7B1|nr:MULTISPECIES: ABC transporter permease subunit [unclassified Paenibacillus]SDD40565.1 putative aldouronate transport system permease protein [Paenibacillus sp. cl123]SFW48067.1 putative aldouronate transport system permease protein [Paenibacillus sp. UNCCL117]